MTNERISFPGSSGTELSARLSLPPDGAGSYPNRS